MTEATTTLTRAGSLANWDKLQAEHWHVGRWSKRFGERKRAIPQHFDLNVPGSESVAGRQSYFNLKPLIVQAGHLKHHSFVAADVPYGKRGCTFERHPVAAFFKLGSQLVLVVVAALCFCMTHSLNSRKKQ